MMEISTEMTHSAILGCIRSSVKSGPVAGRRMGPALSACLGSAAPAMPLPGKPGPVLWLTGILFDVLPATGILLRIFHALLCGCLLKTDPIYNPADTAKDYADSAYA